MNAAQQTGAGTLRTRLILEAPAATPDGAGGEAVVWSELSRPWAEMTPLSGGEAYGFSRADPTVMWRIRIRYRQGVRTDMRLRLAERVFEIRAAFDPDGRRAWLDCLAEERGQ